MPLNSTPVPPPWWKFGHVWLVISGPAIVVVASFITLYLAISRPDPVIDADTRRLAAQGSARSQANLMPAVQGRNHAATGVAPGVKP
jgi:hypothetical protein